MLMAAAQVLQTALSDHMPDKAEATFKLICWRSGKVYVERVPMAKFVLEDRTINFIGDFTTVADGSFNVDVKTIQTRIEAINL